MRFEIKLQMVIFFPTGVRNTLPMLTQAGVLITLPMLLRVRLEVTIKTWWRVWHDYMAHCPT